MTISLLLALACGDKDPTQDSASADADTDTDADSDTDTDTDADTDVNYECTDDGETNLCGNIQFDGAGAASARLQLCAVSCLPGNTDADGDFAYDGITAAPTVHSYDIFPFDDTYAKVFLPMSVEEGTTRELDITVPKQNSWVSLPSGSAGDVELGDGLTITANSDDLTGAFGVDFTQGRAVQVDSSIWPDFDELTGTPVALWYLEPYDSYTTSGDAIPFKIAAASLPGSGPYQAWTWHYSVEDAHTEWESAGTVTVDGDWATSDSGIHVLGTLVLTE